MRISLAPVVAHGIGKDVSTVAECGRWNLSSNLRIPLESVFSVLVPEMESAVRACSAECAMYRVERNGVDREDLVLIAVAWVRLAVAFEGEVESANEISLFISTGDSDLR